MIPRGGRRLVLVCVVVLAVPLLAELALRAFRPQLFPAQPPSMLVPDAHLGHRLTPGWSGRFRRVDFDVAVSTDGHGLRDVARAGSGADTSVVLCIGDSVTWGWGVDAGETYVARLATELARRLPGRCVEVVNAGVPYYSPREEIDRLRECLDHVRPDVVVIQVNGGNDLRQLAVPHTERYAFEGGILRESHRLGTSTRSRWHELLERAKHRSHALFFVSERAGQLAARRGQLARWTTTVADPDQVARADSLLLEMERTARDHGAATCLLLVPGKVAALAASPAAVEPDVARGLPPADDRLVVDAGPAFAASAGVERLFGRFEGYVTAEGHAILASALAQRLAGRM